MSVEQQQSINRETYKYPHLRPEVKNLETGETIQTFGNLKVGPLDKDILGCVDPRESYVFAETQRSLKEAINPNIRLSHHHVTAERNPGGDLGYAMSLLAASESQLTPEQAVDMVVAWEQQQSRKFTFHEDDHKHGLGCGHVDKATQGDSDNITNYGLQGTDVRRMVDHINNHINPISEEYIKESSMDKFEAAKHRGKHEEGGVLVVVSDDPKLDNRTVAPYDDEGSQFFVYNKTRHHDRLKDLAEFAQQNELTVSAENLIAKADQQTNATLERIAAGLPIFKVDITNETPTIDHIANVPKAE